MVIVIKIIGTIRSIYIFKLLSYLGKPSNLLVIASVILFVVSTYTVIDAGMTLQAYLSANRFAESAYFCLIFGFLTKILEEILRETVRIEFIIRT